MRRLNAQELGIAISSVDAVSTSMSMAFSDKDVLAARKLVFFGFLTQLVAYGVQAAAFDEYSRRDTFRCNSSTTNQALPKSYSTFYWVYWSLRVVASILPIPVAHRLTSDLNKIEHKNNNTQSSRVKATALWRSLPATLTTSYLIYGSFVLLHGLSIYNILRGTNTIEQSWLALMTEWGQSANAIIAIFAVGHVIYAIYRLFVAESRNNDSQPPGLSGQSISEAYPPNGWKAWKHWPWNAKWWPFHLGLDYLDHLLVDEGELQRILDPPLYLTEEVSTELWEKLMKSFTSTEPGLVLDCLIHGAPSNRCNEEGDYPIHLAARNNDIDILMRTRFTFDDDIYSRDSLLLRNLAGETPLEIACSANAHEAVKWIMGELPQGHEETEAAVTRAFKLAIVNEREGLLKILQHLWPEWRALKITTGKTSKSTPLRFAIDEGKQKSAYRLVDPTVTSRRQPNARKIFDMIWKSQLAGGYLEIILDHLQEPIDSIRTDIIDEVMGSPTTSNAEALDILLDLGIDIPAILRQSICHAVLPMTHPEQAANNIWEDILREDYAIEPQELESILAFEVPATRNLDDEVEGQKDAIRTALSPRGAHDWSEVVLTATNASTEDLEKLIATEKDKNMLQRMLNVKDKRGHSLLRFTISEGMDEVVEKRKRRLRYLETLLIRGTIVAEPDLMSARELSFRHEGNLASFMLLAVYADRDVLSDFLRTLCSAPRVHNGLDFSHYALIDILLRCNADPTLLDGSGKTPRIALHDAMAKRPIKKSSRKDDKVFKKMQNTNRFYLEKISELLLRWENHIKGSLGRNPLEMPDGLWKAGRDTFDHETWAWLVARNPEGYKVVED